MEKKYELTNETIEFNGHILHRIKALKDFAYKKFKKGDIGGFIESENNLAQEGDCWIGGNAWVYGHAQVDGNSEICNNSLIYGNAHISDNAWIRDRAIICDDARVYDNAWVYGHAMLYDNARIHGTSKIYDGAVVCNDAEVCGCAEIGGEAMIKINDDYKVFYNTWSSGRFFTWTRSNDMWKVGCFYGTGEELIKKAYKDSEESGKNYEKCVKSVKKFDKNLDI